ncbi:26S proteasome regulatory subunit N3 [Tremella mesenterica]|uniref:26S proteasome regulatory subunit N3 n=1 Tax=Tremella mesenterica TaxID=5217 RepID=A0A4Q1BGX4_TREME|nr:26S proteasome regulatory subunit N3 [Tremella mesenterica]
MSEPTPEVKVDTPKVDPPKVVTPEEEVLINITLIGRGVSSIEPRLTARVLRTLTHTRRKVDKHVMKRVLQGAFPRGSKTGQSLIASAYFDALPSPTKDTGEMDLDPVPSLLAPQPTRPSSTLTVPGVDNSVSPSTDITRTNTPNPLTQPKKYTPPLDPQTGDLIPEGVVYLRLLLVLLNLDAGRVVEATELAMETAEFCAAKNRRTMDQLAAKVFFYLGRGYELQGRLKELQSLLLATRQTASLRKDETLECTVINILLRSYLANDQFDQADKLVAKTPFDGNVNQAQNVRYLFYCGRLRAIQLNYAEAAEYLTGAIRRAPKDEVAPGFVQTIHKLYIVVVLLTGVIPDRALFRKPVLKEALAPYFLIVQAVRVGDMSAFQAALQTHSSTFTTDGTLFLILRLRHFVIKTALRTITLAYSRISLRDVCLKLGLDSEEDTEYIVAKAIKDGVIDATIDHVKGHMESKVKKDVYETEEPARKFDSRIRLCTNMYNESVRAMRFPPNAHRKELDTSADARERDREIAQYIADSEGNDDLDDL